MEQTNPVIKKSRIVKIGGFDHIEPLLLGGSYPVVVQTMWKEALSADNLKGEGFAKTLSQIETLQNLGCRILRFAVPTMEGAELLGTLARSTSMPLVADIHFDYKIALRCMDFPIAKIRINPGNIGGAEKVRQVVEKAKDRGVPIRIGVNGGSLPQDLRREVDRGALSMPLALLTAAERELELFDQFGFDTVLVSLKSSSIQDTLEANRLFAQKYDIPLHLGVTEAGPLIAGVVRNAIALYSLLKEGIGATLRVSLSDTMEKEVIAGREILAALQEGTPRGSVSGDSSRGVVIVSCPRCGRNGFDTHAFTERWQYRLYGLKKDITVAIMGCAVNGPGEARHADLGITGAGDRVLIFKHGVVVRTVTAEEADKAFEEELNSL
ncbi:MAG: (E)-4-hydroxy-3-methylbut-2-enyl-diphosphate synthase [Treponemataceae bacterium]|nr:(E)-4-hydroxy-3-methylbut-2-enyl-diphosphate synthase [Treponemataceae bacterium]HOJ99029.1 (E)-4-hydroxy-3-methylbut-2-enyl-diphosphate synthase [Termitinemataceae bacterium]HOM22911.1 (E)-4-hydroxy-3-methylbut-2-enyl-diphosphate synthase [Termitinemataceae bacterium]HPQ00252.1 (E)-4-hydroxy-3-methylbut-2-enyl-diphosphate synthase [Termitinemataceae bacterium]